VYPTAKEETFYQNLFHVGLTFCNEIVQKSVIKRVLACSDLGGGYFEHLL